MMVLLRTHLKQSTLANCLLAMGLIIFSPISYAKFIAVSVSAEDNFRNLINLRSG